MINPSRQLLVGWLWRRSFLARGAVSTGIYCIFFGALSVGLWLSAGVCLVLLVILTRKAMKGLHSVENLPLSRHQLFPYIALPVFSWLVASVVVGSFLQAGLGIRSGADSEPVDLTRAYHLASEADFGDFLPLLVVPPQFWKMGLGPNPPTFNAPWGEKIAPRRHMTHFFGLPVHLYNPYEVAKTSSMELVAWQLSRAVEDVYGIHISPEQIQDKYFDLDDDGIVQILSYPHPFPLREHFPELKVRPAHTLATASLLCILVWGLTLSFGLLGSRQSGTLRKWLHRTWVWVPLVVTAGLVIHVGERAAFKDIGWGIRIPTIDEHVSALAFRMLGECLPENGLLRWLAILLLAVVMYLVHERRFAKLEIPPPEKLPDPGISWHEL